MALLNEYANDNMKIHQGLEEKWAIFVDGISNVLKLRIEAILISQKNPLATRLCLPCNSTKYKACVMRVDDLNVFGDSTLMIH